MKKLFIIISLSSLFLLGCKKDEVPDCQKNNTATLQAESNESEDYEIFIDGTSYGIIEANSTKYVTCNTGYVTIRFLEVNYIPSDGQKFYSGSFQMSACGSYPISFGKK